LTSHKPLDTHGRHPPEEAMATLVTYDGVAMVTRELGRVETGSMVERGSGVPWMLVVVRAPELLPASPAVLPALADNMAPLGVAAPPAVGVTWPWLDTRITCRP